MKLSCLLLISLVMAILSPSLCQENAFENRVRRAADEPRRLMMMMKKCPGTSKPVKPTMKPTKKGKGKGMKSKKASKTCAPTMAPTLAPSSAAPSTPIPSL